MSAGTLRHVVEHALEKHLAGFDDWFPAVFDWQRLCIDAPELVRRLAQGRVEDDAPEGEAWDDLTPEVDLVEAAEATFAAAYVGALAGIALAVEDERDPDFLIAHLAQPLEEAEEAPFEALAVGSLAAVERGLAGQGEALDEDGPEGLAASLAEAAWPGVEVALEHVSIFDPDEGPELPSAVKQVLGGVARVAAILAAFRWLAAATDVTG